ncbi:hypothetical protein PR048_013000 [Dryococelus australis]|uniref:Ig-like domain-containing protein n=1 Tax=Dryococelus australis TaxID=614101 RepID=A0ABQ9HQY5_9NEOP|nr:hypothetical protein PR048_013000 [Dryococelus australis]
MFKLMAVDLVARRHTTLYSKYHGKKIVKEGGRFKMSLEQDQKSYYMARLEITSVENSDSGDYRAVAKNKLGEGTATINLNFEGGDKPKLKDSTVCITAGDFARDLREATRTRLSTECIKWKCMPEGQRDQKGFSPLYRRVYSRTRDKTTCGDTSVSRINFRIPDGKAPRFPKKPTIRQDGDILVMECILEANPVPEITWYQGTKIISDSKRVRMSRKATGKDTYLLTLEISNPTKEDGGNYRCNAFNNFGESNANIALNFQGGDEAGFAPSFVEKPRIIPNETGTLITMRCKCKAKPKPTVTWYRGTTVVKESSKIKMKIKEKEEDAYELTLEIKDPSGEDGGTYRCNVKNEYGESNANLNLNIEAEPEPEGDGPTFVEKPRITSDKGGKLVKMDCTVKANPKPTIVWYHEGKVVKESSKISILIEQKNDIYYIKLELKDPGTEDSGLYKCNIKNSMGELNANLTLNVEIIPVIKEKPKITKIIKRKAVVVECTVQSKFAPQCTWFKEANAVREDSRHSVRIEQIKEGEFAVKLEIESCIAADKGKYKLVAKNEKGEAISQIVELIDIPIEEEKKPGEKPTIIKGLTTLTVEEGKSAEFVAQLKTVDKTVTVTWYK